MPILTIDNRKVEIEEGKTILEAAQKIGIEIPTMCFLKSFKPSTSCMICVVKVEGKASFLPSCATIVEQGMVVQTRSEEIDLARKAALELLLSDHLGDCMGPCHVTCPANMNIPLMIRQILQGKLEDAIVTVKKDIALPAVLGRICPAPCEKACRRDSLDGGVSICLLKRYVADIDLQIYEKNGGVESHPTYSPKCKEKKNKSVAIIGAGPAGLAAAYYLAQEGFDCTIFDEHEKPGGMLQYGVPENELPRDVLGKEIAQVEKLGVKFKLKTRIGTNVTLEDLQKDFDAVFVATGKLKDEADSMGLQTKANAIVIDSQTYQTNIPGVFAGGDAVRKRKVAVRSVADGKEACAAISQYLSGDEVTGPAKEFNTKIGKLSAEEVEKFISANVGCAVHTDLKKVVCTAHPTKIGFTNEEAVQESARCLHCDCRKPVNCKLRKYSEQYNAKPNQYKGENRSFVQLADHSELIFEPGKCIDCGLCIEITSKAGEKTGLAFTGRGFKVRIAIPFERSILQAIEQTNTAKECVKACPTGALSFKISDGDD